MILIERFQDKTGLEAALKLGKDYDKPHEVAREDVHHCVLRERGNEIEIALLCRVPVLVQTTNERINELVMPGRKNKIRNPTHIRRICSGQEVLLRHYAYRTSAGLLANLDRSLGKKTQLPKGCLLTCADIGSTNMVSTEEDDRVERWIDYAQKAFLKREIRRYSLRPSELKTFFGNEGFSGPDGFKIKYPVFIKTQEKGYSRVVRENGDFDHMGIYGMYRGCFVSEFIDIAEDSFGKKEFRIYVIRSNPINAARAQFDYGEDILPSGLMDFAQKLAHNHAGYFQSYILDIALLRDGNFAVIELNNLALAGRYFGNKFESILKACMKQGK